MCTTCGCGSDETRVTVLDHEHPSGHDHPHPHDHPHGQDHPHEAEHARERRPDQDRTHTLELEVAVLAKNDELAEANRAWLSEHGIAAINLMGSPGSGKTTLLERTIATVGRSVSVIEGDQETLFDAERIRRAMGQERDRAAVDD